MRVMTLDWIFCLSIKLKEKEVIRKIETIDKKQKEGIEGRKEVFK